MKCRKGACGIQSARSSSMANARIARFVTEVAPPQFVNVMRHRASKMLDTINEEEREASKSELLFFKSSSPSSSSSNANNSKYSLKQVERASWLRPASKLARELLSNKFANSEAHRKRLPPAPSHDPEPEAPEGVIMFDDSEM
ncbi:hypothetical protein RDI58_026755 [Solanum bulbocastanum]|uniref:Uncharacterized protein n=1 Tax=Solanum bulbocastanum TaxID=147425 RepID=A0AAN8SUH8_SOLBU